MTSALTQSASFVRLPAHIAIIMDGNGRWAEARRVARFWNGAVAP